MKKFLIFVSAFTVVCFAITAILSQYVDIDKLNNAKISLETNKTFNLEVFDKNSIKISTTYGDAKESVLQKKYEIEEGESELEILGKSPNIYIEESPDNQLHLRLVYKSDVSPSEVDLDTSLKRDGKKITITIDKIFEDKKSGGAWIAINQAKIRMVDDMVLKIFIPSKLKKLSVKTVSGDLELQNIALQQLEVKIVSGDLIVKNSNLENIAVNGVSSDLSFDDVQAKKVHVNTISGDVEFSSMELKAFEVDFQSTSGDLRSDAFFKNYITGNKLQYLGSNNVEISRISIKTVSGDARFEK